MKNAIQQLTQLASPLFKDFTLDEIDKILKLSKISVFKDGETIIAEKSYLPIIVMILDGIASVQKIGQRPSDNGRSVHLYSLSPGEFTGDKSIITGKPHDASVVANQEVTAVVINFKDIRSIENSEETMNKLIRNLIDNNIEKLVNHEKIEVKHEFSFEHNNTDTYKPSTVFIPFGWKWKDIIYEASFLAAHGYDAIKISPPQEFIIRKGRPWWEMYQPVTFNLSSEYGSEDDFLSMIRICHGLNIKVYADFILNHMAQYDVNGKENTGTNGTKFTELHYPNLNSDGDEFTKEHFLNNPITDGDENHKAAQIVMDDYIKIERIWHLETHELLGMPKLNFSHPHVINVLRKYAISLLNYGIDGFRIDAAKHIDIVSGRKIFENLKTNDGLNPYIYQEYYTSIPDGIDVYSYMQKYLTAGNVTSFTYGTFISDAILKQNSSLQNLVEYSIGTSWVHLPSDKTVVVIDNHDTERNMANRLNYKTQFNNSYVLGYIFMLAWPFGVPKVMSSFRFEHHDDGIPRAPIWQNGRNTCFDKGSPWVCQHRWLAIANMVLFRHHMRDAQAIKFIWLNGDQVAFSLCVHKQRECLYAKGFVVINNTGSILKQKFETGLPDGWYFNFLESEFIKGKLKGSTIRVADNGIATIEVKPYDAVVISINYME